MKSQQYILRLFVSVLVMAYFTSCTQQKISVLVFSKTAGFRHESIEPGKAALEKMAQEKGFNVVFTEDATQFNNTNLRNFNAVIFLNTTGDVLDPAQQDAFERYIQAGGGYVGIHAATDTEYEWPWYGQLAGAYFLDHPLNPNVQEGKIVVKEKNHWATQGMPDDFKKTDEFYNFRNISPKINVVLTIDETTYNGGKNGKDHPISWYQEFDGGRSFYTAMGHTNESFSEPLFLDHLWAGIKYAAGGENPQPLDYSKSRPEENRFTKVILAEKLDEPMELCLLDEDRVLFIQRKGEVRMFNLKTNELKTIATIPVNLKYVNLEGKESNAEDGLLGLNKDPDFNQNHWIYLYYSHPTEPHNELARFELNGDELNMASKKVILEVPTQREQCCHTGGSIAWDSQGNLYLSTGDNTNPFESDGYSPSDERPGRGPWDAQKSSANTNDLRGKIIRIKPQPDGTYTIPEGNLFPQGTPKTRPEIYTMGHRNPYRISIDQKTGFVYWGDVGPDASKPDSLRGPAGHDEVGQARKAGNFGWPHFVGNNKAYFKYDFEKKVSLEKWDANAPSNTSPNNTGMTTLPPAQSAFIWYPYDVSPEFPLTGSGGRNAMAGPVFYSEDFQNAPHAFPKYYNGKLFTYDWIRGWIMSVTMDKEGNFTAMERFMPSYKFSNPVDMEFAANGDLYMLEYGTSWFSANDDARLVRIEYNGGNRSPQVQMLADKTGGSLPFTVNLTSSNSTDPDGDPLSFSWKITSENGFEKVLAEANPHITLEEKGVYLATLTVDDGNGGVVAQSIELIAGNEPPALSFEIPQGNRTFFIPNQPFQYEVKVSDKEDGALGSGIDPELVAVNIDYLAEGFDQTIIAQGHRTADEGVAFAKGRKLIADSDCKSCHNKDKKSIGPTYRDIALRYKEDKNAVEQLAQKIITGGSGVWGQTAMAAHPQISTEDASEIVKYILSVANEKTTGPVIPPMGTFNPVLPEGDKGVGVFIARASYEDQGTNGLPPLRTEQILVMRNSKIDPHGFDDYKDVQKMSFNGMNFIIPSKSGSYVILKNIDLSNIDAVIALATAPKPQVNAIGGAFEVHLDAPDGALIGTSNFLEASETMSFKPSPLKAAIQLPGNFDGQLHDVYLVFVNPAQTQGSLLVAMGIEFHLATPQGKPEF